MGLQRKWERGLAKLSILPSQDHVVTIMVIDIVTCQAHPVLVKANQVCGSSFLNFCLGRSGPPVDGPKDPWPRVLSLAGRFVGDPASLARDNIYSDHGNRALFRSNIPITTHHNILQILL